MDDFRDLARDLGGSFAARVRGIVSPEMDLLSAGDEPFGRVWTGGGEARVQAGGLSATVAPSPDGGHAVTAGGVEILTAEPAGSATTLRLTSDEQTYEANLSPLRNTAVAHSSDGEEIAHVSGGLAGRRYEATFDPEDPVSLPVAIFLLQRLTNLRTRAYRT